MEYLFVLTIIALSVVIGFLITDMETKINDDELNDSETKERNKK